MTDGRLITGILGLDPASQFLLEVLSGREEFRIHAIADRDRVLVERVAARYGAKSFNDYRQFIVQNQFDCLIVGEGPHLCIDHMRMALKRKIHVLRLSPMARTFEEAASLAALALAEQVRFDVACPLTYGEGFVRFRQGLSQEAMERPFLVRTVCDVGREAAGRSDSRMAWITHQDLAGGGVLLYDGYELADELIRAFGLPQQVFGLSNSQASDQQQIRHLTEDNCIVTFRFGPNLIASLVAMRHWDDRPASQEIHVYNRDRIVVVRPHEMVVHDSRGAELERQTYRCDARERANRMLARYALSVREPKTYPFSGDWEAGLRTMALMEAAYLSCRTGSPETPSRFLDQSGLF